MQGEKILMLYIIEAISLIVIIFCIIKTIKNWWDESIITAVLAVALCIFTLTLSSISIDNYSNTFSTVSTNTTQYDIVEFNKSTLINNSNESYIITYKIKGKDNNEFKISADNDTNIVIDNDNPTKVLINEELKYSECFFAHEKTITYTFQ